MTLVRGIDNICNKTHTHEDTTPYQHIHPTENVECIVDEKHLAHGEKPTKKSQQMKSPPNCYIQN